MKEPVVLKIRVRPAGYGWCPGCGGLMMEKKISEKQILLLCLECGRKEYKSS